jgi:hypothetical protein
MVIHDLDIQCIVSFPTKYDAPLLIDWEAPVAGPVAVQLFQPVARWDTEELQRGRCVDLVEQTPGLAMEIARQHSGISAVDSVVDVLGCLVRDTPYHQPIISDIDIQSKTAGDMVNMVTVTFFEAAPSKDKARRSSGNN